MIRDIMNRFTPQNEVAPPTGMAILSGSACAMSGGQPNKAGDNQIISARKIALSGRGLLQMHFLRMQGTTRCDVLKPMEERARAGARSTESKLNALGLVLEPRIVRIDLIDIFGRNELVLDENRRRN